MNTAIAQMSAACFRGSRLGALRRAAGQRLQGAHRAAWLAGVTLGLAAVLAGCGGGSSSNAPATATASPTSTAVSSTNAASAPVTVSVTANDFVFKFSQTSVPAGTVHFVLQNDSKTYQHELWVYPQNQPRLTDLIKAEDAGQTVNAQDYLQGVAGHTAPIDPGKSATFDAQLAPGQYEVSCLVASSIAGKTMVHYEMGMHGLLTVS